jgi:hypothetical protein
MRKPGRKTALILAVLLPILALSLWMATYPDNGDPKNIKYVLWKNHLNPWMNLDVAVGTMTHDRNPERLVLGMTPDQLEQDLAILHRPSHIPNISRNALRSGHKSMMRPCSSAIAGTWFCFEMGLL